MPRVAFVLAVMMTIGCQSEPLPRLPGELRAAEFGPVPDLPSWPDLESTPAKDELGRRLFFDPRLSASGNTNCDICHVAATRFQDNLITAVPDRSYPDAFPRAERNTTSMLNIVYAPVFRWDGSTSDLIEAMVLPFAEPNMNLGPDIVTAQMVLYDKLTVQIPEYVPLYENAFGLDPRTVSAADVFRWTGQALAVFSRRMISRDSAFDQWNAGDDDAMSASAVRGFELFRGKARCAVCHSGPFFTDYAFHNVSTSVPGADGQRKDEGRFVVTGNETDRGAFLTPTLRSVIDTQPYFHDGGSGFIRQTIMHFISAEARLDPNHDGILDFNATFTDAELDDLVEFLRALRGAPASPEIVAPEYPSP